MLVVWGEDWLDVKNVCYKDRNSRSAEQNRKQKINTHLWTPYL